jgi:hypothetical protein
VATLFVEGNEEIHTWRLKLDLGGNMDETNPSFLGLYFHRVVVSRWFPVVDDVQGLGLEGKVKMINGVHGYSVVGKEIHSDEQGHPNGQLRADVLMEELLLHKMTQGIPHLIPVLRALGLMSLES